MPIKKARQIKADGQIILLGGFIMTNQFTTLPIWVKSGTQPPVAPIADEHMVHEGQTNDLNYDQEAAIIEVDGLHSINAGAGTGKSTCLIARLKRLISQNFNARVSLISFTKKAAQELKDRLGATNNICITTFHSLAYHILKSCGIPFTMITNQAEQVSIVNSLIKKHKTTAEDVLRSINIPTDNPDTLAVRKKYLSWLLKHHVFTFDTLQLFAIEYLRNNPALLRHWQEKYSHWLVDEYQDVDQNQQTLIRLLSAQSGNLTVAGDSRQSIYSFRGSVPSAMDDFINSGAVVHPLTINFRCNPYIIALSNRIMPDYPALKAAKYGDNYPPQYLAAKDESDEAHQVVQQIIREHKAGSLYKNMAVLYRSSSAVEAITEELLKRGIPFVSKSTGSQKYMQKPYADIIKMFRYALSPHDNKLFHQIMPLLYLRSSQNKTISAIAKNKNIPLLDAALELKLPFFHKEYLSSFRDAIFTAVHQKPDCAVRTLLNGGYAHYIGENLLPAAEAMIDELKDVPSIAAYLTRIDELLEQSKKMKDIAAKRQDHLELMTIHSSKGKEWDTVFLVGAYDGCIPSAHENTDMEEERRLLYVAITRARQKLFISYPIITTDSNMPNEVCRFLKNIF